MPPVDNKRIAQNAVALTIRMALITIIGLYTSRVVLQVLGVEDYGIYGVIGGVVGLASFLNAAMAGATSRFLTFDIGRNNGGQLSNTFSTAFFVHLIIAIFIAILAETLGLWFINNKMNFPPDKMFSVNVLYQFSIIGMIVSFTQVPYSSLIIAHERMKIFAYLEIINSVCRLLIVFILMIASYDLLILYSALSLGVGIAITLIYRFYCIRQFPEAKLKFSIDKSILKSMLSYSACDLYGNMCIIGRSQGIPIIINIFFGVVANAASSIANTVSGAIKGYTVAIMQAFLPPIVKLYAINEIRSMRLTMSRAVQFSLFAFAVFAIPFYIDTALLLNLWLGLVPEYSVDFTRLIIISSIFDMINRVNHTGLTATGRIKYVSFISGTLFIMVPVLSYLLLKYYCHSVNLIYIIDIFAFIFIASVSTFLLHKQIPELDIKKYIFDYSRSLFSIFLTFSISDLLVKFLLVVPKSGDLWSQFIHLLCCSIISAVILSIISLTLGFDNYDRKYVISLIKSRIHSIF